jgi:diguanylate cyclase (GGDEF)-like protein
MTPVSADESVSPDAEASSSPAVSAAPAAAGSGSPTPHATDEGTVGIEEILVVDDSPTMARLLELGLRAAGFRVRVAHDGGEALEMALEMCPDLILADVMMPVLDGVQLTRLLRDDPRTASAIIILVTAKGYSSAKLEGFEAGADDYIVKPFDVDELLARVRGALRRAKVLRAQSPLTRLPGNVRIQEEIELRVRRQTSFSLLYCDLDNFKAYNDKYGFLQGDRVIQMTARVLQDVAMELGGSETFVGHVGGDDFVVIAQLGREREIAEAVIERFDAAVEAAYDEVDRQRGYIETLSRRGELQRFPIVSVSIGVATTERRTYSHYAEAVAIATEMKTFMKKTPGSSWAVDVRSG